MANASKEPPNGSPDPCPLSGFAGLAIRLLLTLGGLAGRRQNWREPDDLFR
jgi:hypothetical protein